MSPLRRRQDGPRDEETQARRTLERATAALRHYQRSGLTMVAVEDVLTLLGDHSQAPSAAAPEAARDPRADPMTGCLPVTPGS